MNKTVKKIAIISLTVLAIITLKYATYYSTHYTLKDCKVVETSGDEITVEDTKGELWCFYGDNFSIGDTLDVIMDNNNTMGVYTDDKVEKIIKK
jgi:hypothetical protein